MIKGLLGLTLSNIEEVFCNALHTLCVKPFSRLRDSNYSSFSNHMKLSKTFVQSCQSCLTCYGLLSLARFSEVDIVKLQLSPRHRTHTLT